MTVALVLSSAVPPGVAVAQEADQGREGVAAPEQAAPDSAADPDFDPGGETELPFDVGTPNSGDDDSDDGGAVDTEPVDDPEAPPVPVDDPRAVAPEPVPGSDQAAEPVEATPPAEPVVPATPPAPAPAPPAATTPLPPAADAPAPKREKRAQAREPRRDRSPRRHAARVPAPAPAPASPAPALVETTATVQPVAEVAPPAADRRAKAGQNSHTVQPGESLWTIATDLLHAGATDVQIAAETDRLYRLNRNRIGGDPNMLIAGTVLRLR